MGTTERLYQLHPKSAKRPPLWVSLSHGSELRDGVTVALLCSGSTFRVPLPMRTRREGPLVLTLHPRFLSKFTPRPGPAARQTRSSLISWKTVF